MGSRAGLDGREISTPPGLFTEDTAFDVLIKVVTVTSRFINFFFANQIWVGTHRLRNTASCFNIFICDVGPVAQSV